MSHNNNISENAEKSRGCGYDINKISSFLAGIHQQGERFELTALRNSASPLAVICTTDTAAEAFANLYNAAASDAKGFYVTLNPSRLPERVTPSPNRNKAEHIEKRTHLVVDIDGCKNGTTPEERNALRAASIELAQRISAELTTAGWREPVIVNSGNGAQMWYRIDEPTESDIVRRCLVALAARYNGDGLEIDTAVSDAPRVARLPGTWNRKPEYPSDEWRMADVPGPVMGLEVVPHEKLEELAKDVPAEQAATGFDWGGTKTIPGLELDTEENRELYREYLRHREGGVEGDGGRRNFLETARFGGDFGLSPEAIWEELTTAKDDNGKTYNDRCAPPWEYDEAMKVIRSSFDGRREPVGCKTEAGQGLWVKKMFEDNPIQEPATNNTTEAKPAAESGNGGLYKEIAALVRPGRHFYDRPASKKPDCWVDKRIPVGDYVAEVFGAPGCGKSVLVHQMCICILNGLPFWGYETKRVAANGRVFKPLIVACEEDEDTIARHIQAQVDILCNGNGEMPDVLYLRGTDYKTFFTLEKSGGRLSDSFNELARYIRNNGYTFIVVDNRLETFGDGDENKKEHAGKYYSLLDAECFKGGFQILMIAHSNKQGNESGCTAFTAKLRLQLKAELKANNTTEIYVAKENFSIPRTPWGPAKMYIDESGDKRDVFLMAGSEISEAEQLEMVVNAVKAMEPDGIGRDDLKEQLKKDPFFGDGDDKARAKIATRLINLAKERKQIVLKIIKGKRRLHIVKNEAETV